MGKFKGTKQRWRIGDDFHQITTSKVGVLEGSRKICTINFFGIGTIEAQANAKLIAAAPEMLKALMLYEDSLEGGYNLGDRSIRDSIKEAIKKATE